MTTEVPEGVTGVTKGVLSNGLYVLASLGLVLALMFANLVGIAEVLNATNVEALEIQKSQATPQQFNLNLGFNTDVEWHLREAGESLGLKSVAGIARTEAEMFSKLGTLEIVTALTSEETSESINFRNAWLKYCYNKLDLTQEMQSDELDSLMFELISGPKVPGDSLGAQNDSWEHWKDEVSSEIAKKDETLTVKVPKDWKDMYNWNVSNAISGQQYVSEIQPPIAIAKTSNVLLKNLAVLKGLSAMKLSRIDFGVAVTGRSSDNESLVYGYKQGMQSEVTLLRMQGGLTEDVFDQLPGHTIASGSGIKSTGTGISRTQTDIGRPLVGFLEDYLSAMNLASALTEDQVDVQDGSNADLEIKANYLANKLSQTIKDEFRSKLEQSSSDLTDAEVYKVITQPELIEFTKKFMNNSELTLTPHSEISSNTSRKAVVTFDFGHLQNYLESMGYSEVNCKMALKYLLMSDKGAKAIANYQFYAEDSSGMYESLFRLCKNPKVYTDVLKEATLMLSDEEGTGEATGSESSGELKNSEFEKRAKRVTSILEKLQPRCYSAKGKTEKDKMIYILKELKATGDFQGLPNSGILGSEKSRCIYLLNTILGYATTIEGYTTSGQGFIALVKLEIADNSSNCSRCSAFVDVVAKESFLSGSNVATDAFSRLGNFMKHIKDEHFQGKWKAVKIQDNLIGWLINTTADFQLQPAEGSGVPEGSEVPEGAGGSIWVCKRGTSSEVTLKNLAIFNTAQAKQNVKMICKVFPEIFNSLPQELRAKNSKDEALTIQENASLMFVQGCADGLEKNLDRLMKPDKEMLRVLTDLKKMSKSEQLKSIGESKSAGTAKDSKSLAKETSGLQQKIQQFVKLNGRVIVQVSGGDVALDSMYHLEDLVSAQLTGNPEIAKLKTELETAFSNRCKELSSGAEELPKGHIVLETADITRAVNYRYLAQCIAHFNKYHMKKSDAGSSSEGGAGSGGSSSTESGDAGSDEVDNNGDGEYRPSATDEFSFSSWFAYRPQTLTSVPKDSEREVNTDRGNMNIDVNEAIRTESEVGFMGSLTQVLFHTVGEILFIIPSVLMTVFVLVRTTGLVPAKWFNILTLNKLDAMTLSIPKFVTMSVLTTMFGALFVTGDMYAIATRLISWVVNIVQIWA